MAIKFTFILNDPEAENLFHILRAEESRMDVEVLNEMAGENRVSYIKWYEAHKAYIGRIVGRMLGGQQERIPDSDEFSCEKEKEKGPEGPKQEVNGSSNIRHASRSR